MQLTQGFLNNISKQLIADRSDCVQTPATSSARLGGSATDFDSQKRLRQEFKSGSGPSWRGQ